MYERLSDSFNVDGDHRVSYEAPTNFTAAASAPRHRWFSYKEGFSPKFVTEFLSTNVEVDRSTVIDPFSGVGTTVLETAIRGGVGIGFDVNPLAHFVSKTKGLELEDGQAQQIAHMVASLRSTIPAILPDDLNNETVKSYFEPRVLDVLLKVRTLLRGLPEPGKSLLKLALLENVEAFSTHRKAGNGVKKKSPNRYKSFESEATGAVIDSLESHIELMTNDIFELPIGNNHKFHLGSALEIDKWLPRNSVDAVLTSPPYANCFDYSKIYMRELWLGDFFETRTDQAAFRSASIRSHVHARWQSRFEGLGSQIIEHVIAPYLSQQNLWSAEIPSMLVGYFRDMGRLLLGLRKVVKRGGHIGLVVGNSIYGGVPIATDLILGEIAQLMGFTVESIQIVRHIVPSSQQYLLVGDSEYSRESVVTLVA